MSFLVYPFFLFHLLEIEDILCYESKKIERATEDTEDLIMSIKFYFIPAFFKEKGAREQRINIDRWINVYEYDLCYVISKEGIFNNIYRQIEREILNGSL